MSSEITHNVKAHVELLTTSAVAVRAGVEASTVRRWIERGLLKPAHTTLGGHYRFDADEVDRALGNDAALAEAEVQS